MGVVLTGGDFPLCRTYPGRALSDSSLSTVNDWISEAPRFRRSVGNGVAIYAHNCLPIPTLNFPEGPPSGQPPPPRRRSAAWCRWAPTGGWTSRWFCGRRGPRWSAPLSPAGSAPSCSTLCNDWLTMRAGLPCIQCSTVCFHFLASHCP